MKWPWNHYCLKCNLQLEKKWWIELEYDFRCKCPNCQTVHRMADRGAADCSWTEYEIIPQILECNRCGFKIKDDHLIEEGCSHFNEKHPQETFSLSDFLPTGFYHGQDVTETA